jgi:hypothetical protein
LQADRTINSGFIEPQEAFDLGAARNITKVNLDKWTFTVDSGRVTISSPDGSISRSFPPSNAVYNQTGIFDKASNRLVSLPDSQKSSYLIRYPYVIEIDKHLPIMRIYDQDKCLLNEYSVLDPQVPQLLENIACPDFTYLYQNTCVTICPLNYYHYKNGTKGRCTLSPFPGSVPSRGNILNNGTNNTYNYDMAFKGCPYLSTNYTYGCICLSNTFFDFSKWLCVRGKLMAI